MAPSLRRGCVVGAGVRGSGQSTPAAIQGAWGPGAASFPLCPRLHAGRAAEVGVRSAGTVPAPGPSASGASVPGGSGRAPPFSFSVSGGLLLVFLLSRASLRSEAPGHLEESVGRFLGGVKGGR